MRSNPAPFCTAGVALTLLLGGCQTLQPADKAASAGPAATTPRPTVPPAATAPVPPAPPSGFNVSPPATAGLGPGVAASAPAGVRPLLALLPGALPPPPPFATVIREARRIDGPLTLWQKEDKVWIELLPAQLNKPFMLSPKIKSGIGEAFVLGGLMALPFNGTGGAQIIEFVRVHNQVRLQARNTDVTAVEGTPEARAVAASYSHSLLGATPVASQPHPDRKSVLIEANTLFLSDMLGIGTMLQRGLRQGYGLDRANTVITEVRASEQATVIETQSHFYSGSVAAGSSFGGLAGVPTPQLPRYLPDARSLLIGLNFSIAPLPETPMAPRRADPRVGLFTSTVLDFSDDLALTPRQRLVNRMRLDKKDPAAAMSPPVKPITFWIDRNVPLAYRDSVRAAILEWNRAFEKIGFSGAIQVEQQPDDAKFDTLDFGYASVRWMMNADPAFAAIGPSHVDPRTGEILDADIAFEGLSARSARQLRTQVIGAQAALAATSDSSTPLQFAQPFVNPFVPVAAEAGLPAALARCQHGLLAAEQMGYALDVLEARGELEPDSPIARQFVQDYVKQSILHEVGHALGLRHNFRASRAYTESQLSDAEFTRANGTSGSVMEYNAVNLPLPGKTGGVPFHTALGPYDFWAVEYAYKPLRAGITATEEKTELQLIAARSSQPELAFGTDEDNFVGLDPETIQLDLGRDPLQFAAKRLAIARDLFKRQETRSLPPDRDYAVLRRSIGYALSDATRAIGVLARQIGGVRTLRDFPGSGREPLVPVSAQMQREALDLILRSTLSTEGLTLSPALQRRLAPDFLDRAEGGVATDFSVQQSLFSLQRAVLNYLLSDVIAARILDNVGKLDRPSDAFQLGQMYQRLADDVWSELASSAAIAGSRRDLQRDHVNRLALAVVRPSGSGRADVRGHLREQARTLLA
ncbi:MAG: zinc-dependent metalloprotease, partial [Rubrivivax sp.]|nr:zinc-dependent metalloprotease [Rubrivivax sp.]